MQKEIAAESLRSDLPKLIGCILTDITVATFFVRLVFSESISITVRINKEFGFSLSDGEELHYDPTSSTHDISMESAKFIFMQGRQCRSANLDQSRFEVSFNDDSRLWVELNEEDFEPLEFTGASGERRETLDFYYVL